MNMNNGIIWLYWENKLNSEEPILVTRCKELTKKYNNVVILDQNTIHEYLTDLIDCSRLQHLAQKADYYRARLLYEYGGIWLDMDTILLEDVTYLYNELLNTDFEMRGNYDLIDDEIVFNPQFLIFKPKSIIAEKWYKYDEEIILSDLPVPWATLGGIALGKIVHENNYINRVMSIPTNIRFDFGYINKSYEKYYSIDDNFVDDQINNIKNNNIKYVTLYGTFMYVLKIPENCILDKIFKLKNKST